MSLDPLTLGQILRAQARLQPDKIGARDLERAMTYRQWNERACKLASALLGLGLRKGATGWRSWPTAAWSGPRSMPPSPRRASSRSRSISASPPQRRGISARTAAPQRCQDGRIHPMAIFEAIRRTAEPDDIGVADGGDLLSFARVGMAARTYMDAGAFGCLGVGVPFAVAAALACPDRQVISVNGDGAFGLNAMEIDTAVRHGARALFIVSNNAAWNIERFDQEFNYGGRVVGTTLRHCDYAAMARALGAHGERIEDPADLDDAIARGLDNAPALIDVVTSQHAVSSDAQKGLGFVTDYQPLSAWDEAERKRRSAI